MSLKTKVLISSVTNLSDARYATGMGVDFIGFSMNDNDTDFIGYTNYTAITTWLQGMSFAGEFNNQASLGAIKDRATEFGFKTIITPNNALVKDLQDSNYTVILKQITDKSEDIPLLAKTVTSADFVLIETTNDTVLSLQDIATLSSTHPLLVGTQVTPEDINELIEKTDMEGIALKGSEEIRTGFVDLDAMADLLEAIEID